MRRFLVVGNPENRRVVMFRQAVENARHEIHVLPWTDALQYPDRFQLALQANDVVRVESPGENTEVERLLIHQGADISSERANYSGEFGRIENSRHWFLGFRHSLHELERFADSSTAQWMNHPEDVALMFDKPACQRRLQEYDIPVPQILGTVRNYDDLTALMRQAGVSRVFLKPPHGSSASGVIALQTNGRHVIAQTSVEMQLNATEVALYNSLAIRRYSAEREIAQLIDTLGESELHVERWIPKAGINNHSFDLRVVVIAGRARHIVVRTSRSPMTNLHLGNVRGDLVDVQKIIPRDTWAAAIASCEKVARIFPRSLYFGVDLMFTSDRRNHFVLEVNAFGDLLPNVVSEGESTYEAEISAVSRARNQADRPAAVGD